jgi:hypothetical protein
MTASVSADARLACSSVSVSSAHELRTAPVLAPSPCAFVTPPPPSSSSPPPPLLLRLDSPCPAPCPAGEYIRRLTMAFSRKDESGSDASALLAPDDMPLAAASSGRGALKKWSSVRPCARSSSRIAASCS